MFVNGPAVGFSKHKLTTAPGSVPIPRPKYSGGPESCHVFDPDRPEGASWGTILIGAGNLSPVTKLVTGTGPEYSGRYKLSRSQKFVKVQDFDCGQMRAP